MLSPDRRPQEKKEDSPCEVEIYPRNSDGNPVAQRGVSLFEGREAPILLADIEIKNPERIVKLCEDTWQKVYLGVWGVKYPYQGHIRFDMFVADGNPEPIEVNVRGPEELAAACASYLEVGRGLGLQNPAEHLAPHLDSWAEGKRILFLCADNDNKKAKVKKAWGSKLLQCLQEANLDIEAITSEEFLNMSPEERESNAFYAFGDIVLGSEESSYFSQEVCKELFRFQEQGGKVLNVIAPRGMDLGNKLVFERALGRDIRLFPEDFVAQGEKNVERIARAIRETFPGREDWVFKPVIGASGDSVVLGDSSPLRNWRSAMGRAHYQGGSEQIPRYFLSPRVHPDVVRIGDREWVVDVNPSFFANGEELRHMGFILRAVPLEVYEKTGMMNVSMGGGMSFYIDKSGKLNIS